MRRDQQFALECEQDYVLDYTPETITQLPEGAREIVKRNWRESLSTAIGRHPELGWFVISTSGQGPCFDWTEW